MRGLSFFERGIRGIGYFEDVSIKFMWAGIAIWVALCLLVLYSFLRDLLEKRKRRGALRLRKVLK